MTVRKPYDEIGAEGIERLVERFYHHMQVRPEAATILAMHPSDLGVTKATLRAFLSMWLGGPDDFRPVHGEPFLRRRHLRFPIDGAARDAWMHCMRLALDEVVADARLREHLVANFQQMADHMVNRASAAPPGHRAGLRGVAADGSNET
ncbi:MAG: group II truncated hemoglobin [Rhodocyclaceae bacterium]|nr:group II truncated hemoglobin [Rhodocyclaceae bacterium]